MMNLNVRRTPQLPNGTLWMVQMELAAPLGLTGRSTQDVVQFKDLKGLAMFMGKCLFRELDGDSLAYR